ncbi:MAG: WD40 repeat domain-containing protein [Acidimicrobiia bacterium]
MRAVRSAAARPAGRVALAEAAVVTEWAGSALVCACADGSVVADGHPLACHPPGPGVVTALAWGRGREPASIDHRGTVRAGASLQCLGGWGRRLWWSGPGRLVAVTSEGIHAGPPGGLVPLVGDLGHVREACLLPARRLAVGTADGVAFVDHERGSVDGRRTDSMACALTLSASGEVLAVGAASGSVHVVNLESGDGVEIEGYGVPLRLLAWCGSHLAVGAGRDVTAWPVTAEGGVPADEPVPVCRGDAPVTALASPPSAAVVAAGDGAGTVRLAAPGGDGGPLFAVALPAPVVNLAWSADGSRLAAACADGGVHRFDVALG